MTEEMLAGLDKKQLVMIAMMVLVMGLELPMDTLGDKCRMVLMIDSETNVATKFLQCYE
jgi:hypothetical protein